MNRSDLAALARMPFDPRAIRAWLKALRPPSLVIAGFSCFLGVALAYRAGRGNLLSAVLVVTAGVVLQAGVNLVNDFFEFKQRKIDDTIARLEVFGAERELLEWFIFLTGLACFALVAPVGLYLAWRTGWPLLALGAAGFAGGYFYTGEPFAYKRRGLGVVFVFFLMGVFMVVGSHYATAGVFSPLSLWASIPVSILVSLILLANELRDFEPDSRHGIRTLAVRIGYRRAAALYFLLLGLAYAGPWVLAAAGLFPRPFLTLAAAPLAVPPSVLLFRPSEMRARIIPLVMLHHLCYGALYCAAYLARASGG
ncbi:MAG: prenyltransferase [Spirochaetes bacterium]|nr:prenyltransferase [Spirochaetota bacterium]